MPRLNAFLAGLVVMILMVACASIQQPKSPAELLGVTYTAISAQARALAERYEAGAIEREDALAIRDVLQRAYNTAQTAERMLMEGNEAGADTQLQIAQSILSEVERQLREAANDDAGSAGAGGGGESRIDAAQPVERLGRAV